MCGGGGYNCDMLYFSNLKHTIMRYFKTFCFSLLFLTFLGAGIQLNAQQNDQIDETPCTSTITSQATPHANGGCTVGGSGCTVTRTFKFC